MCSLTEAALAAPPEGLDAAHEQAQLDLRRAGFSHGHNHGHNAALARLVLLQAALITDLRNRDRDRDSRLRALEARALPGGRP